MLAVPSTGASGRRPILLTEIASRADWMAEVKEDGIRAVVESDGRSCRIWNRNGVEVTEKYPEIARQRLSAMVLDGEIVPRDGTLSTVLKRDKRTSGFDTAAKADPCEFRAFDILSCGGQDLTKIRYRQRRVLLEGILRKRRNIRPVKASKDTLGLWREVVEAGGEGIVVKQKSSLYIPGKRCESWIKFKALRRVTAIAAGAGSTRGLSIELALLDDFRPVPIGRVGTGWTVDEERSLRESLSAGKPFLVEVQALGRSADNRLRSAVYMGVRSDLVLTDAKVEQLADLPLS